jgi:outer membrane protein W
MKLISILSSLLLFVSVQTFGQVAEGNTLLGLNLALSNISEGHYGEAVTGGAAGFTYEKMISDNWALGANFSLLGGTGNYEDDQGETQYSQYRAYPTYLTARYVFLEGSFQLYVCGAAGISWMRYSSTEVDEMGSFGLSLAAPVGFFWHLDQDIFLNMNYTPIWIEADDNYEGSSMVSAFNLGFGWKW